MRRAIARAFAIVAAALLAYVAYAHVAEWRLAREYADEPLRLRFDGAAWARDLDVARAGAFDVTTDAGRLVVRGSTGDASSLSSVTLLGPRRRLRDVALRLRFRLEARADVDVAIGVVRDAPARSEVAFGARDFASGDGAAYRFFGEERAQPPERGDAFGAQRFVALDRPEQEHEVALRVSPDLHVVLGSVDGAPVASHAAEWDEGEPVRLAVFVRARSPGQRASIAITQADWEPIARDVRPRALDERFDGQVIDASIWRVAHPDGWSLDGVVALAPGGGVDLRGRALRPLRETGAAWLVAPTRALGSFRAAVTFDARDLRHARFYLAVSNLLFGLPQWRAFEVGLASTDRLGAYVAGHYHGDQSFAFDELHDAPLDAARGELAIAYDARARTATATLDGRVLATERLDLQPPEEVHLDFGVRAIDEAAAWDVRVARFVVEPRP